MIIIKAFNNKELIKQLLTSPLAVKRINNTKITRSGGTKEQLESLITIAIL